MPSPPATPSPPDSPDTHTKSLIAPFVAPPAQSTAVSDALQAILNLGGASAMPSLEAVPEAEAEAEEQQHHHHHHLQQTDDASAPHVGLTRTPSVTDLLSRLPGRWGLPPYTLPAPIPGASSSIVAHQVSSPAPALGISPSPPSPTPMPVPVPTPVPVPVPVLVPAPIAGDLWVGETSTPIVNVPVSVELSAAGVFGGVVAGEISESVPHVPAQSADKKRKEDAVGLGVDTAPPAAKRRELRGRKPVAVQSAGKGSGGGAAAGQEQGVEPTDVDMVEGGADQDEEEGEPGENAGDADQS